MSKTLFKYLFLFLAVVATVFLGGCASMAGPVQGVRDWIGDAGSPVSDRPLFQVYQRAPKSTYTPPYRAGDNEDNYYRHHTDKPQPPRERREATYGSAHWESNPKTGHKQSSRHARSATRIQQGSAPDLSCRLAHSSRAVFFLVIFDVDPQPAGRFFDLPKEALQIKMKPENIL